MEPCTPDPSDGVALDSCRQSGSAHLQAAMKVCLIYDLLVTGGLKMASGALVWRGVRPAIITSTRSQKQFSACRW